MTYRQKRAKATDIPEKVKKAVYRRDNGCCIFCGRRGLPEAHYIARSHGGLGIEQNIVTACRECHERMDNSEWRDVYRKVARDYLREIYGAEWSEENLIYKKNEYQK